MHTYIVDQAINGRLRELRNRIENAAAAGAGQSVRLVAAIKYLVETDVPALVEAGVTDLGENRVAALETKRTLVERNAQSAIHQQDAPRWHYIGRLQSRAVPAVVAHADVIHTVARASSLHKLARCARDPAAGASGAGLHAGFPELYVQVNVADDPRKDGLRVDELTEFLDSVPPELSINGLMTMPDFTKDPEQNRAAFAKLRELRDSERERWRGRHPLRELSMGTSQDFEVAVEEGATVVRLGRILYA